MSGSTCACACSAHPACLWLAAGGAARVERICCPSRTRRPAPVCQPTALLLRFNLTAAGRAALSVPLHAKYPEPLAFGFAGWRALLTGALLGPAAGAAVLPALCFCVGCAA